MVSSLSSGSIGPKPVTSLISSWIRRSRSRRLTAIPCLVVTRSNSASIRLRTSAGGASISVSKAPMTSVWRMTRASWIISSRATLRGGGGVAIAIGTSAVDAAGGLGTCVPPPPGFAVVCAASVAACCALATRWDSDIELPPVPPGLLDFRRGYSGVGPTPLYGRNRTVVVRGSRGRCRGVVLQRACAPGILAVRRGAIAQLGERLNGIQKVRGSNPLSSTNASLTPTD